MHIIGCLTAFLPPLLAGLTVEEAAGLRVAGKPPCLLAGLNLEEADLRVVAMALVGLNIEEDAGLGKVVVTAPGRSSILEKHESASS